MVTRRMEANAPPNYLQEMATALSAPALPGNGCFRPFEREGLIGLGRPDEAQKARMVELAGRLSEQEAKRAMLEILWAWPREKAPYQVAPPLPLGHCLQGILLEEAERRGMLRITRRPAPDGSEKGAITHYHPVDRAMVEWPKREEVDRATAEHFYDLMGGVGMPFLDALSPLDHGACRLLMYGLVLSDWQMRLLPGRDRALLLRPLPAELVARMEAQQTRAREEEEGWADPSQEEAVIPVEGEGTGNAAAEHDAYCRVFLARLHCAEYRWLQSQDEKERAATEQSE